MDYWVRISQRQTVLGAGIIVNPYFALTAAHCLSDIKDEDVDLALGTDEEIPGRVCERAAEADLALIRILKPLDSSLKIPHADRAVQGDTWFAPYRPDGSGVHLDGHVVSGSVAYQCEAGAKIEALQLNCSQQIGNYSGYSGGPIERCGQDAEPSLVGMLIEQYFDCQDDDRVSNVLFAATILEAERRFQNLGLRHMLNVLDGDESTPDSRRPPVQMTHPNAVPKQIPDVSDEASKPQIAEIRSRIEAIHECQVDGLLFPLFAEITKLFVAWKWTK
jgi:hypothetical protein